MLWTGNVVVVVDYCCAEFMISYFHNFAVRNYFMRIK